MKLMIFVDSDNFKSSVKEILKEKNQDRIVDFYKIPEFVIDYLSNNQQFKGVKFLHVRTYFYTGEYTDSLFKRIKDAITSAKTEQKPYFQKVLDDATKHKEGQKKFLELAETYNFFEVRKKPLQFSATKGIFQKGVDVQIAVDLVSNAYLKNYDVAVLLSGDIDLLESLKTIKGLGKQVIIFSHYKTVAKDMRKETDMFIDIQKLDDANLDKFSHRFQKKNGQ